MGLFDFFKKKKEININYTVNDLKKGFFVDYFLQSWEVKKVDIYDWGNNRTSREYLIDSGTERQYLHVEDEGQLVCTLSKDLELNQLPTGFLNHIVQQDDAPQQLVYKNETYQRISSAQGFCGEEGSNEKDWSKFVNWMFENENGFISIDRWGEEEFSAATGKYVQEIEFSNILPK